MNLRNLPIDSTYLGQMTSRLLVPGFEVLSRIEYGHDIF